MTEREYFKQIEEIRKKISNGELEYADELLTKMYCYKPVRLLWFVAKAEYILKKDGDPVAALRVLDGDQYSEIKYFLGENYPGLKACMEFRINTFRMMRREQDAIREEYRYQRACGKRGDLLEKTLAAAVDAFAEDAGNKNALKTLGNSFYHTADIVSYFIIRMVMLQQGLLQEDDRSEWFYQCVNFGYLEEQICAEKPNTFILIMDEHLTQTLEVLGFLLHSLGHTVYLLSPPLNFETESQIELSDTLAVSLNNAEQYPDMCIIPPVMLTQNGEAYGDNRDYIIDHICRNESIEDQALLLCSGELLDSLYRDGPLRGRLGRLSAYETDFQEEKLQFGWAGNYLTYISNIYGYDVRTDIEAKPGVDFSIIVPARNSSETLKYTLETCLNQRYTGSYEIIVSDNSVENSTEVYDLCQKLDDSRIRYVKTPRSLYLTKSFEFAYLQARGEFIFSIGSDDGVLPWTLDVLKRVLNQFPGEEILQWDRGFYAWPGFNGGQENMFVVPRAYTEGKIEAYFERTEQTFERMALNQQEVYATPMLYINSGFRRRYLKTLLQKTGKLFDGCCQDLQTSIVNCCVNSRFLRVLYPLTIAGMSVSSVGYLVNSMNTETEEKNDTRRRKIFQLDNVGKYVALKRERLMNPIKGDAFSLYVTLSKAVEEGLLSAEKSDQMLDWQTAILRSIVFCTIIGDGFDCFVHSSRFMSKKVGEKAYEWFGNEIYPTALLPQYQVDDAFLGKKNAEKSYEEGTDEFGGEILDASKYSVRNIVQAVELFAQRTGL